MTQQPSFLKAEFAANEKMTRRNQFLARKEVLIPWAKLLVVIEPFHPNGHRSQPFIGFWGEC